jgi:hypothetical protein
MEILAGRGRYGGPGIAHYPVRLAFAPLPARHLASLPKRWAPKPAKRFHRHFAGEKAPGYQMLAHFAQQPHTSSNAPVLNHL